MPWRDGHAIDVLGYGAEVVLVALLAAQEVEAPPPALDRVLNEVAEQDETRRERRVVGVKAGVVESHDAIPLEGDEGRERALARVEEPEPRHAVIGEGADHFAEEGLHAMVHESRLAGARAPVQAEEVIQPSLDVFAVRRAGRVGIGNLAREAAHLPRELVALLAGEGGQVVVPGGGQIEDRTALLHRRRHRETEGRGDSRGRRDGDRARGHGVEVPDPGHRGARGEERRPRLLLAARSGDEVEVVRDVGAPDQLHRRRAALVERQERDGLSVILDAPHFEPAPGSEGPDPFALPGPREKGHAQAQAAVHRAPGDGADRLEAIVHDDLHNSGSAAPESDMASCATGSSSDPAIASSTASSRSPPMSSPSSRPIFFMKRATLAGSFSSMSPKLASSASASSLASSDLTVAKRDMRRVSAAPPQRGHRGASAVAGRSTSRLTTRRQSRQSYS